MKRFLTIRNDINGFSTGANINRINNLYQLVEVNVIAGQYNGRKLYEHKRRIPYNAIGFHDVLTAERVYSQWAQANDLELSLDSKCSYGTSNGPGFTIRLTSAIFGTTTGFGFPAGRAVCEFRALYFTP